MLHNNIIVIYINNKLQFNYGIHMFIYKSYLNASCKCTELNCR